jgi:hypothetical protein
MALLATSLCVLPSATALPRPSVELVWDGPVPTPVISTGLDAPSEPRRDPVECIVSATGNYTASLPPEGTPPEWMNAPQGVIEAAIGQSMAYLDDLWACALEGVLQTCAVPAIITGSWLIPELPEPSDIQQNKHGRMEIPWVGFDGILPVPQRLKIDIDLNGGADC